VFFLLLGGSHPVVPRFCHRYGQRSPARCAPLRELHDGAPIDGLDLSIRNVPVDGEKQGRGKKHFSIKVFYVLFCLMMMATASAVCSYWCLISPQRLRLVVVRFATCSDFRTLCRKQKKRPVRNFLGFSMMFEGKNHRLAIEYDSQLSRF
jgi:hypothetical protein